MRARVVTYLLFTVAGPMVAEAGAQADSTSRASSQGIHGGAQSVLRPVLLFQPVSDVGTLRELKSDSSRSRIRARSLVEGGLLGGLVGFVAGGLLTHSGSCDACYTGSGRLGRNFAIGASIGTITGVALAWLYESRRSEP